MPTNVVPDVAREGEYRAARQRRADAARELEAKQVTGPPREGGSEPDDEVLTRERAPDRSDGRQDEGRTRDRGVPNQVDATGRPQVVRREQWVQPVPQGERHPSQGPQVDHRVRVTSADAPRAEVREHVPDVDDPGHGRVDQERSQRSPRRPRRLDAPVDPRGGSPGWLTVAGGALWKIFHSVRRVWWFFLAGVLIWASLLVAK